MEVTPKTLREAEFREVKRGGGYLCEDVDDFIEDVAKGVEQLQERLRQALERASRAEAAASEVTGTDETLRRTLVLAQRTADLAVQEAREQAARILAGAEQQAQAIIGEAEQQARRAHGESVAAIRTELNTLETARARAQAEVDALQRWASDERAMIVAGLREAAAAVERAGGAVAPPASAPLDAPTAGADSGATTGVPAGDHPVEAAQPSQPQSASAPSAHQAGAALHENGADDADGPPTVLWQAGHHVDEVTGEVPIVIDGPAGGGLDEQALDEFFDDASFGDDRRLGGRLRRRR